MSLFSLPSHKPGDAHPEENEPEPQWCTRIIPAREATSKLWEGCKAVDGHDPVALQRSVILVTPDCDQSSPHPSPAGPRSCCAWLHRSLTSPRNVLVLLCSPHPAWVDPAGLLVMKQPGLRGHFKNSAPFNRESVSPAMNIAAFCSSRPELGSLCSISLPEPDQPIKSKPLLKY